LVTFTSSTSGTFSGHTAGTISFEGEEE
jgi:hypothetical protein